MNDQEAETKSYSGHSYFYGGATYDSHVHSKRETGASCFRRLRSELNPCQDWFLVGDTETGRKIDIPESFAPEDWIAVIWKMIAFGITLLALIYGWMTTAQPEYFVLDWSNLSLLLSTIYLTLSLINSSVLASRTVQPPERVTGIVKLTWVSYILASHAELLATIIFWAFEYSHTSSNNNTRLDLFSIASHGVVAILVLTDGMIVNRIPLRLMHWCLIFLLDSAYIGWTIAQSLAGIALGKQGSIIYKTLDWKNDWETATAVSSVVVLGVGPLLFLLQWLFCTYWIPCGACMEEPKRLRYVDRMNHKADVEEGTIFGQWGL